MSDPLIVVTGAGGFIGGHLVGDLLRQGAARVRAVDCKPLEAWWQRFPQAENLQLDLQGRERCEVALAGATDVYNLSADMGGMGFIENNKALCMLSVLINTHLLLAARKHGVRRYFFSSSACVYAADKQTSPEVIPLKEADAYPAMPEDGYGWEKLFSERMCRHFREDFGITTRVARYHNVYGPCYDEQTEILTEHGFRAFADLTGAERVATLNPQTGTIEYQRPVDLQAYEYEGPMYRIQQQRVDLLITPDHSVWYAPKHRARFRLDAIGKLADRGVMYFSRAAKWKGGRRLAALTLPEVAGTDGRSLVRRGGAARLVTGDVWLRFLGWYLSEGSCFKTPQNHVVCITQYDSAVRAEIRDLIRKMGFRSYEYGNDVRVFSKQLYEAVVSFGKAHDKHIPRALLTLPPGQLRILFETLMRGDGNGSGRRYSTVSRRLADDFQELALKLGLGATVVWAGSIYRVNLSKETVHRIGREHRSVVRDFRGMVYDVTVPEHHVILVRRNGKVVWSGNCGSWIGGREKAPAAVCRKVAEANLSGRHEIEIWGDGNQTRSFMFIDDCLKGTQMILRSDILEPLNLGSDELVSINQLVDLVEDIAGIKCKRRYKLDAPKGVNGRNSDNTRIQSLLGWAPNTRLRDGLEKTYAWVFDQVAASK